MDRSLYVAMSGAKQILQAQASNSNNLSNANTTGFRSDLQQFRSMPVFGPGQPSRVYAMVERPATDFSHGAIQATGRDLDVAIKDNGWIAVQSPDGSEAYTRAGDLRLTPDGLLQTSSGLPVFGNGGPIAVPPAQKLEIGQDGTISVVPLGQPSNTLAIVDRIKLVDPPLDQLEKLNDGLMHLKGDLPAPASSEVTLISGSLETSNVNAVDAMVRMIELARQFEMQIKVMKSANDNDAASAQLLRIS